MTIPVHSLFDAPENGTLPTAVDWLAGTLTGSLATALAILAIAAIGLAMLRGRIDLHRGAAVLLGCFILFGAPRVADGIYWRDESAGIVPTPASSLPQVADPPPLPVASPSNYDPYAGASVPR